MVHRDPMVTRRDLAGRAIYPIGFGAMNLSIPGRPERDQAIRTIHAALDAGMELVDTADCYALGAADVGHNERLVSEALATWPGARPIVATKGGVVRPNDGWAHDGRPAHLRAACEASLAALGVDAIDLYQLHRVDENTPLEDSVGELARLRQEGKVRAVGLSNATVDELERARAIVPIASVQNEASPYVPTGLTDGVLAYCEAHAIAFLAYAPVGGWRAGETAHLPALREVADALAATPFEVALAWLLHRSRALIPIPGASRPENARSSARAATLALGDTEARLLDDAFTARREGERDEED
jgi:aryl-alcohol dehydrogenase-like predicted oxidoreductase